MDERKTILIPLDGSGFSRAILAHVKALFPARDFKLMLLQIAVPVYGQIALPPRQITANWPMTGYATASDVELAKHPIYMNQEEQSAHASYMDGLETLAANLTAQGYAVTCDVWFGPPAESIITYATTHHADVIAMATHARSSIGHLLLGGVAEDVLRQCGVPVLLVHPERDHPVHERLISDEHAPTSQHTAE